MEIWVYFSAIAIAFGLGFLICLAVFADRIRGHTPSTSTNSASMQYLPDEKGMKHAASQWIDYLSTIDSTYSDLEQTFIQGVRWGIGQLPGK